MRILFLLLISISSQAQLLSFINSRSRVPQSVPSTLTTNLLAYYKLDESSGVADDAVGTKDGTLVSTTQGAAGKINTAYSFNGTSSYVNLGTVSTSNIFSFAAWINLAGSGSRAILSSRVESGTTNGIIFMVNSSNNLSLIKGSVATLGSSTGTITSGTWTHVAVTYSSAGVYTFYINGTASGTGTNVQTFNHTAYGLGARRISTDYFNGSIDEVAIYNRDLTGAEVASLFNSGSGSAYPFDAPSVPMYDTTFGIASNFNPHLQQPAISGWADFNSPSSPPHVVVKSATQNGITVTTNTTGAWEAFFGNSANNTAGETIDDGNGFFFGAAVQASSYYNSTSYTGTADDASFLISGMMPDSLYEIRLLPSFSVALSNSLGYNSEMVARIIDRDGTVTYDRYMDGSRNSGPRNPATAGVMITGNTSKYLRMWARANFAGQSRVSITGSTMAGGSTSLGAANAISIRKATITAIP